MSAWPPNPYLDAFLRSPEGQTYLANHGYLEAWRSRHLLDDETPTGGWGLPIVPLESIPEDTLLFVPQPRHGETTTETAQRAVRVVNVAPPADLWDF